MERVHEMVRSVPSACAVCVASAPKGHGFELEHVPALVGQRSNPGGEWWRLGRLLVF
jgi:hypothetical protein